MTKRAITSIIRLGLLAIFLISAGTCHIHAATQSREYTEEHPLIIGCDSELRPYEFRSDDGKPQGYNVELIETILKKLGIPYKIIMKEWAETTRLFASDKCDLIFATVGEYKDSTFCISKNTIKYYKVKVVHRKGEQPSRHIRQLIENDTVLVKRHDYTDIYLRQKGLDNEHVVMATPKEALADIVEGRYKYFVWGEASAQSMMTKYGMDNLEMSDINIPVGEFHIIGHDKELMDKIDDQYSRLVQSGDVEIFNKKWFHPDEYDEGTSPVALLGILIALAVIIIGLLVNRLIVRRIRIGNKKANDLNSMMSQALIMSDLNVLKYDIRSNLLIVLHGDLLEEREMTFDRFIRLVHPDDINMLKTETNAMTNGELDYFEMQVRLNRAPSSQREQQWEYYQMRSTAEKDDRNTVKNIISTLKDINTALKEEKENSRLRVIYQQTFDNALAGMAFYDINGKLLTTNKEMQRICHIEDNEDSYLHRTSLFETTSFKGIFTKDSKDPLHMCSHVVIPEQDMDEFVEFRLRPIMEGGDVTDFTLTVCDVSNERDLYLEQIRNEKKLTRYNEELTIYESKLRHLLENSNTYIWQYDKTRDTISFSRSLNTPQYKWSLQTYKSAIVNNGGNETEAVNNLFAALESGQKSFSDIYQFWYTPFDSDNCWYAISGQPQYDADNKYIGYTGIFRNVTTLMNIQERLQAEAAHAQEAGQQKSIFLANMTHEIRTPLNAIVGFSDVLLALEGEDKKEFVRIIRQNCDMLLRLINDILEISSLSEGKQININPTVVDFPKEFDDICQTMAQRVMDPNVEFIKDNPLHSFYTRLDIGRIRQIITNFVTNAVKYTQKGHIKVGYAYKDKGLYVYCEDTGVGIPKEKQSKVFERFVKLNDFVQGTGLGLSICKAIVERCEGKIGLDSEGEGCGTTFWMWIPCPKLLSKE